MPPKPMPNFLLCPHCGYSRSWSLRRYHRRCKKCRKEWSPGSFHPVWKFRLSRREWLGIIETFMRDGTTVAVQDISRLAHGTATKAVKAIRSAMSIDVPELLMGVCEADETYIGGSWKNKAIHIRRQGSKRGRGTSKQPIFGVIQRAGDEPSRVRVWLTKDTKNQSLDKHIFDTVVRGSVIYTDGRKGYRRLPRYGYFHDWVDHEAGEYVRGPVHTQNMDGYWGRLKTHLGGIGGIRKSHLPLFVAEHVWRFNFRHLSRKEQAKRIYSFLTKIGGRF